MSHENERAALLGAANVHNSARYSCVPRALKIASASAAALSEATNADAGYQRGSEAPRSAGSVQSHARCTANSVRLEDILRRPHSRSRSDRGQSLRSPAARGAILRFAAVAQSFRTISMWRDQLQLAAVGNFHKN